MPRRKLSWPRCLALGRATLAAASPAAVYLLVPSPPAFLYVFLGAYVVYASALAIREIGPGVVAALLTVFIDTVAFLVIAAFSPERFLWLASAYFLYVMTEALSLFGPLEVAVTAAIAAVYCLAVPGPAARSLEPTVVVAGALACGFAVNRRRAAAESADLRARLDEATKSAAKAKELERQRIASDFHDGPLQSFISLQMRLEILRKLLVRDFQAGMEDLQQLQSLALLQVRDLRAFLHSMRPVDVDGANLVGAARRTAESFQKESGIPVTFLGTNAPVGLPPEMTTEVLQMLREALHNVQKHAGATRVAVALEKTERGLEISVDDNGHGFNFAGSYSLEELELLRLGPASLKRRARSLNADLMIESRPGRGAGLKFRVPLQ